MKLNNEQLRHLRIYHGMTLKEFAARVGTSYVTIHKMERGTLNISDSMRARIVEAFGVTQYTIRTASKHYRRNIAPFEGEERQRAIYTEMGAAK